MSKKKKGSCLGAIFKFLLIVVILGAIMGGLVYFAIASPNGFAGKAVETVFSPFVSKDLKASMDSAEEFLDQYIETAKALEGQNTAEMNAEMAEYLDKYQQAMNDLSALDKDDLNWFSSWYYFTDTPEYQKKQWMQ